MCPKLTRLAELVLTIPVSNAWPEKGASKVKIIKTDLRNYMYGIFWMNQKVNCIYYLYSDLVTFFWISSVTSF
jgi:hypothetical protein